MGGSPITLEQFKAVCARLFPGVPVTKAPPREPFPDKVYYDCHVCDTLWLRFCYEDKYMDNHVCIFGMEPPKTSPKWDIYVYTEAELMREMDIIVPSLKRKKKGAFKE